MRLSLCSMALAAIFVSQSTLADIIVEVDRATQTIKVKTPTSEWEDRVSTGGGLKIPNGVERSNKTPYCANDETPTLNQKSIKAIESGKGVTMKRVHYSNTFSDAKGNKIAMPWAINLGGGIYFHEAPPAYVGLLGKNVSGGCIRLSGASAQRLYAEMLEFGGMTVSIYGDSPTSKPGDRSYCTPLMVEHAKYEIAKKRYETGRELSPDSISDIFGSIADAFSGKSSSSNAGSKPVKKKPVKERDDDSWATNPLGQY